MEKINSKKSFKAVQMLAGMSTVFDSIQALCKQKGISYRHVHHLPTKTSQESASARHEHLSIGGKALLLKVGKEFRLFVLSAALKIDIAAIRLYFGEKNIRFASEEELKDLTGLKPGSVPPFGKPMLPFPLYVDPSVLESELIAFNAGSLTDSIIMDSRDYCHIAKPKIFEFAHKYFP